MLLQALQNLARRPDVASELPREAYRKVRVRHKVVIDEAGRLLGVLDLAEGSKAPGNRGLELEMPTVIRQSALQPLLFADGADYTFGLPPPGADPRRVIRTKQAHRAYLELVNECATEVDRPEVRAVEHFLRHDQPPVGVDPSADAICFEVGGTLVSDLPEVVAFWTAKVRGRSGGGTGQCLVCGESRPIVSRWPVAIRGIPGGQTSGSQLSSANMPAFESYGLQASATSPACYECARESALGLNWLLSRSDHHLRTSDTSVFVFWTRTESTGFSLSTLMSDPRPEDVDGLLRSPWSGSRAAIDVSDDRFYAVLLAPSGARIAVRRWIDSSIPDVKENLANYFRSQWIIQPDGRPATPISMRRLLLATTRNEKDADGVHPALAGQLLDLAVKGTALPPHALAAVLRRISVEHRARISHARAALLKLALVGAIGNAQKEAFMQRLDSDFDAPAYHCGRLLAELEAVQRAALGNPAASLTDRYFGAASSCPATVFGPLLRNAQNHLGKLRRERYGTYRAVDRRLEEIASKLTTVPAVLTLKEQAVFALGYYHQKADDRAAANAAKDSHLASAIEPIETEIEEPVS